MEQIKLIPAKEDFKDISFGGLSYYYNPDSDDDYEKVNECYNIYYGNQYAGGIALNVSEEDKSVKIQAIMVLNRFRNKGIGKYTVDYIKNKYKDYSLNIDALPKSKSFWQKQGFDLYDYDKEADVYKGVLREEQSYEKRLCNKMLKSYFSNKYVKLNPGATVHHLITSHNEVFSKIISTQEEPTDADYENALKKVAIIDAGDEEDNTRFNDAVHRLIDLTNGNAGNKNFAELMQLLRDAKVYYIDDGGNLQTKKFSEIAGDPHFHFDSNEFNNTKISEEQLTENNMKQIDYENIVESFLTKYGFDEEHGYTHILYDLGKKQSPLEKDCQVIRIDFTGEEIRPGDIRLLKQKAKLEGFECIFEDADHDKNITAFLCYFPIEHLSEAVRQAYNGSLKALDVEDLVNKAKVRGSLFTEREFNNKLYFITVSPPWFGQEPSAQNKIRVDVVEEDEDGNQERVFIDEYTDYDTVIKELEQFIRDTIEKNESVKSTFKFKLVEDKLNEIYPDEGESKKDFISRFMSATKDEYPDVKQRYAVANSYWKRRDKR